MMAAIFKPFQTLQNVIVHCKSHVLVVFFSGGWKGRGKGGGGHNRRRRDEYRSDEDDREGSQTKVLLHF